MKHALMCYKGEEYEELYHEKWRMNECAIPVK